MIKKLLVIFFSIFIIFAVIYFFLFNDSYKKSLQARVYFDLGEYNKAFKLSKEAYLIDPYNRMALTVLNASKASLKYKKFINDAKEYLKKIEVISSKSKIHNKELIKIKLMCEIVMGEYERLKPIVISDKKLIEEASSEYKKFEKIYEELFKK